MEFIERLKQNSIVYTQIAGFTRSCIGLPIEHFFDRLKVHLQSNSGLDNKISIFQSCKVHGIRKIMFQGLTQNFYIYVLKGCYRWPLMLLLPQKIKETFPQLAGGYDRLLTGFTLGTIETLVTCPLERRKCLEMTQLPGSQYIKPINFLSRIRSMYTGVIAFQCRLSISWMSYLFWDDKTRTFFRKEGQMNLQFHEIIACSVWTTFMNILITQPLDTLKTLCQMENNALVKERGLMGSLYYVYKTNGLRGIYSGGWMRMSNFFIQVAINTPFMEHMERNQNTKMTLQLKS